MAQLAYRADPIANIANSGGEGVAKSIEPRWSVSLFADTQASLEVMTDDVALAGFAISGRRELSSLLTGDGIVLGDVVLIECAQASSATMAALIRLDERAARAGAELIVSTRIDSLEDVFGCVDRSNAQILVGGSRGERLVALGGALASLPGSRLREMEESDRAALIRLTDEVSRLARKLDGLSGAPEQAETEARTVRLASPTQGFRYLGREGDMARKPRTPLPDPRLVKAIIRERQRRAQFFDGDLFADPAWDILLDLTAARAEHRRVSVTSLCIAANVPATTALRWITQMVDAGILARVQDDTDRRRAFIVLTDDAADAMARYFDGLGMSEIGPI